MKNKWTVKKLGVVLLCAVILSACSNNSATTSNAGASSPVLNETNGTTAGAQLASVDLIKKIEYAENDYYTDWSSDNPIEIKLNGSGASVEGSGATVKDSTITITAAGTYVLSGKLDDGQIVVNVQDKGIVRLVLNGVDIYNSSTAPIYVEEAGKTIISLQEGTENQITDGEAYVYPDASTDEPNATIFSKDDLTINGTGKLIVQGNYNNGITSKDELKITGGTLEIHAVDDGLMGRDLVAVQEGNITIEAGGHGVKTTNDEVDSLGYIDITGGSFSLNSGEDALHSSGGIGIADGDIAIAAGDDAIHADVSIAIAGGTIDITKSNEGIEAPTIKISDGTISVVSTDDGVNAAGGDDASTETEGSAGSGGPQSGAASSNMITISGGNLTVDAQGDGLDANGSIVMTGGTVMVNGPTNNGNGALDYDGTFEMTGGVLVAAGSSGMAQATSDSSTQYGIMMTYPQTQSAGTMVHLEDSEGNNVITFAPSKDYQSVFISSPNMKKEASYTLYSGGTSTGTEMNGIYDGGDYKDGTKVVEFQTASIVTWLNESGVTEARSGMGGPGGGNRGQGGNPGQGGDRTPPDGERPMKKQ
ncbi:carbohydrate-binding domain-containing protein [Cohnella sp. WQ 127256]|uniref:carbohydrate-binding domain-containing protein n=1 Tax=Cohnella sp. WQ 127256 TaxID=2938790 RepID=UPI0021185318|nr:carbohydrate-binding domain-containing protein [Cohnella sp. WQ 127256]